MVTQQQLGTAWIYSRILGFCEDRTSGIGGNWAQSPYKDDFVHIYYDAETCSLIGTVAAQRHKRRCARLKKNRPSFGSYAITPEAIREFLQKSWLKGRNNTATNVAMVDTLCGWWEAWQVLATCRPRDYSAPKRRLTRLKSEIRQWVKAHS
jgi:hypothetical protein